MRILITNWTMRGRHGSVMHAFDLAVSLLRRGWQPLIYAPEMGEICDELRRLTIPVTNNLASIAQPPDVIHGNSCIDTLTALLHFPSTPAIGVCHAWDIAIAQPFRFPRILEYVAVDEVCRSWLIDMAGIAPRMLSVIPNGVDLDRFRPRKELPEKPTKALVFSNYATEGNYLGLIREACKLRGIQLDVIGSSSGNECIKPETVLGQYDIVFGKARCALEAVAVGCAVILCDIAGTGFGLGGLVTPEKWQDFRSKNLGRRTFQRALSIETLLEAIDDYDPIKSQEVSAICRATCDQSILVADWMGIYQKVADDYRIGPPRDPVQESVQAAELLNWLSPRVWQWLRSERDLNGYYARMQAAEVETIRLRGTVNTLGQELHRTSAAHEAIVENRERFWREEHAKLEREWQMEQSDLLGKLENYRHENDQLRTANLEMSSSRAVRWARRFRQFPIVKHWIILLRTIRRKIQRGLRLKSSSGVDSSQ